MRSFLLTLLFVIGCANPNPVGNTEAFQVDSYATNASPECQGPTMQFDVYSASQGHPNALVASKLFCADVGATDVAPTCKFESSQNARDSDTDCGVSKLLCVVPGKKPFVITVPNTCVHGVEIPQTQKADS